MIEEEKSFSLLELSRKVIFFYIYFIRNNFFFIKDSQVEKSLVIENVLTNQLESEIIDYNENQGIINEKLIL